MESYKHPERVSAVVAAAAHELNDELTVILSSITDSLDSLGAGHATAPLLEDARAAAQRCAWKTGSILHFARTQGARPAATPLAILIA